MNFCDNFKFQRTTETHNKQKRWPLIRSVKSYFALDPMRYALCIEERIFQNNRLYSVRPDRYDVYGRLREFGDAIEIISNVCRQVFQFPYIGNVSDQPGRVS